MRSTLEASAMAVLRCCGAATPRTRASQAPPFCDPVYHVDLACA